MAKGKIWWIADDEHELAEWKKDWQGKPIEILKVNPHDDSTRLSVIFELDRAQANDLLGYEVGHDEWLTEENEHCFTLEGVVVAQVVVKAASEADALEAIEAVVEAVTVSDAAVDGVNDALKGKSGSACLIDSFSMTPDDSVFEFGADLVDSEPVAGGPSAEDLTEYTYDVKFFVSCSVLTESEADARSVFDLIDNCIEVTDEAIGGINSVFKSDGKSIEVVSVSSSGCDDIELTEVDGKDAHAAKAEDTTHESLGLTGSI